VNGVPMIINRARVEKGQSLQYEDLPRQTGKTFVHRPGSPTWTEGQHTIGCRLVPPGDRLWHCNTYPSAMQPSARYLSPWLGQTGVPLANVCLSNRHQSMPSAYVNASNVTQDRVEYESTTPRGTDEGLDLWESFFMEDVSLMVWYG
jgi:hypothetical protein